MILLSASLPPFGLAHASLLTLTRRSTLFASGVTATRRQWRISLAPVTNNSVSRGVKVESDHFTFCTAPSRVGSRNSTVCRRSCDDNTLILRVPSSLPDAKSVTSSSITVGSCVRATQRMSVPCKPSCISLGESSWISNSCSWDEAVSGSGPCHVTVIAYPILLSTLYHGTPTAYDELCSVDR